MQRKKTKTTENTNVRATLKRKIMPILPVPDMVVFPGIVMPLFVNKDASTEALMIAIAKGKQVFLAAQKDPQISEPTAGDLYLVGVVANVLQVMDLSDGQPIEVRSRYSPGRFHPKAFHRVPVPDRQARQRIRCRAAGSLRV